MFKKLLIANRGEIAVRIIRSCREFGIQTVAVHSTADESAMHVQMADETVCIGPPSSQKSYLNIMSILSACEITGADAVHPGYGFLSENADFAEILETHKIIFVGPTVEQIRKMGDKTEAKKTALSLGLPIISGSDGNLSGFDEAIEVAKNIGFPILLKATAGGGGKGMKIVHEAKDIRLAFETAEAEAGKAFGNKALYLEKYLDGPRHIEIQVLGDGKGNAVHLGERDCSLQRRHQKILEEAPALCLEEAERKYIGELSAKAVAKLNYRGVGTIEYLYKDKKFYFIEMNTRLQVEHPITEMITGIDLVEQQLHVAAGDSFDIKQENIKLKGHAIECRINAEDYLTFMPQPGTINYYHSPEGPGVRMDSAIYSNYKIPPYYDSLIAKMIVYAKDRETSIKRLRRVLDEIIIEGVKTTIPLFRNLVSNADIIKGKYNIKWLEKYLETLQ